MISEFETLSEAFLEGYADFTLGPNVLGRCNSSDDASSVIAAREYVEGFCQAEIDSEFINVL